MIEGRATVTVGELIDEFADQIPLQAATRKWAAGRSGRPLISPDRMRFFTLTQYLHWLQCSFATTTGRNKTRATMVTIVARPCEGCGGLSVREKQRPRCGARCPGRVAA